MRSIVVALALFGAACSSAPVASPPRSAAPPALVHVVIVGTTDLHGNITGKTDELRSGDVIHRGSLPVLAAYVAALRAKDPGHVILVDSGDLFQGTLESNLFEGEPVVRAYNAMGYAAAAVGNHEFDYGPVGPHSVALTPGEDPLGALKRNVSMASFPFLSANLVEKATGLPPAWVRRSIVVPVGNARIGIIGLSTPTTPSVTTAANVVSLEFTDPVKAAVDEATRLRAGGVDAVVVIAHMGGRCSDTRDPNDLSKCEDGQEAMRFLRALPPGTIDGYFGGHTHQQMRVIVNGVPASQAAPFSQAFSTIELWVDPAAHRVAADKTELRPFTQVCIQVWEGTESCDSRKAAADAHLVPRTFEGTEIRADAAVAAVLQPYLDQTAAKRNEPTGIRTAAPFGRQYRQESALGDLLTDALRDATGTDIALINSGAIRTNLRGGDLVYSDLFDMDPFDDYAAVVPMTGAQVIEAVSRLTAPERGILQVSGIHYAFDEKLPEGNRLTSITLADGSPIDPARTFQVSMPDFLSGGGDGLDPVMHSIPSSQISVDRSTPLRDVLESALRKWPQPIRPKPLDRIRVAHATNETGG